LSRSDYFSALFSDHFHESDQTGASYTLHNISYNGLRALKSYCYTEEFPDDLDENDLIEILEMSDFYMLPGMKKVITTSMVNHLRNHNVIEWLLRGLPIYLDWFGSIHQNISARLFSIGRLEERCLWHIASNFEYFCHDPDFEYLIESDAAAVVGREKEDSIEIVDELRFQFTKIENNETLNYLLDLKLDKLGFKTFAVFYNTK